MATPGKERGKESVLALIVNTHSRQARRKPHMLEELDKAFGDRGPFIRSKTAADLPVELQSVRRANPEMIIICGGDGTLRQTLTHLIAAYEGQNLPPIALLRGGTMNSVATSLEIYRDPPHQLRLVLERFDQGLPTITRRRHLLQINRYFGFIFALGGFSRFIEMYVESFDPTPMYAFKLVTKTVLSAIVNGSLATTIFKPFEAHIWRDGQPLVVGGPITNMSASTIRHIGFHCKPYIGAEEPEETFGLLVFRTSPRSIVNHLPEFFMGKAVRSDDFHQIPAKEVLMKVEHPMRPMLDGDLLKPDREFLVRTGPGIDFVVV